MKSREKITVICRDNSYLLDEPEMKEIIKLVEDIEKQNKELKAADLTNIDLLTKAVLYADDLKSQVDGLKETEKNILIKFCDYLDETGTCINGSDIDDYFEIRNDE